MHLRRSAVDVGPSGIPTEAPILCADSQSMFDRQLALEKQQGYRGPATRLVGPIKTVLEADLVIRECSLVLIVFGALQWFLSVRMGGGSVAIGVTIMITAAALRFWPGLSVATLLLLICIAVTLLQAYALSLGYMAPLWFPLLRCAFAVRAFWAALRRRRLQASEATDLSLRQTSGS